ncbi:MAG: hypothetical protein NVSMB30_26560 [Hymenobacter sp.]
MLLATGTARAQSTAPEGGTLSPATSAVCAGMNSGTLTLSGYAGTIVRYQADSGNGFADITNTAPTYTFANLTTTTRFRALVNTTAGVLVASTVAAVTVNAVATPTLSYPAASYCQNGPNPVPTVSVPGGTFSSTAGLSLNTATGVITPSASQPGTYTVTYTAGSPCPGTGSTTVTINATPSAAFSYSGTAFCQAAATNPVPTITGATGGAFYASSPKLSVNPTTGAINLAASSVGTYAVTYIVSGPCPSSSAVSVGITAPPAAGFSYSASTYCAGAMTTTAPVFAAGARAGQFMTSNPALRINVGTGVIDLSRSLAGTYLVTNTVAGSGGCTAAVATATVTLSPAPPRPTVTRSTTSTTTTLTSSAPDGNQWYRNGVAIAGATGPTYVIASGDPSGSYAVVVTGPTGCASQPSVPTIVTASLDSLPGTALQVYPNPTHDGLLTLTLTGYPKVTTLTVLNALGQVVLSPRLDTTVGGTMSLPLDLSPLAQGVYTLRLLTEGGAATRCLVRE